MNFKKFTTLFTFSFFFTFTSFNQTFVVPTPPPMPKIAWPTNIPQPTPIKINWPTSAVVPTSAPTKVITPTPTKNVVSTPTPTKRITPTPTKTPTPTQSSTNTVQTYIMAAINKYRASQGLSAVKTDSYTCGFAKVRAKEISVSFNHNGFSNRITNHTLPYSSYHEITENIAMTSNYQNVVNMWINSPGHAANMRANTPYVCVEQYGNYFAYEGWRP